MEGQQENKSGSVKGITSKEYKREYYLKNRDKLLNSTKERARVKARAILIERLNNGSYDRWPTQAKLDKYNIKVEDGKYI